MKWSAVLYHYPCPDGAFAALAAHLYFKAVNQPVRFIPNPVYNPISAQTLASEEFDDIYLLDFAGSPGFISELSLKSKSITILDHHKTTLEMFSQTNFPGENLNVVIDMKRSGATIAYDFFKTKLSVDYQFLSQKLDKDNSCPWDALIKESGVENVGLLFKLVEDGDLWNWALPGSKAFSSGLKNLNIEYDVNLNPDLFNQMLALDPEFVIHRGQQTLQHEQKLIDESLENSYEFALGGGQFGNCLAVNADAISNLRSELGHQLANKSKRLGLRGVGAVVYKVPKLQQNQDLLKVSLRSVDTEDTIPTSQAYGGGGHRNASSFMIESAELERWKVGVSSRLPDE